MKRVYLKHKIFIVKCYIKYSILKTKKKKKNVLFLPYQQIYSYQWVCVKYEFSLSY